MFTTTFVLPFPLPVLVTDSFGTNWLPALMLEVRNGVALVQIGDYCTVRALNEVRRPALVSRTAA